MKRIYKMILATALSTAAIQSHAGQATIPNTFTSGTPAVAADVNANFSDVKTAVNDNDARIAALENTITSLQGIITNLQSTVSSQATTITTLQAQLMTVNNSQVMALEPYLTVDTVSDSRGPQVRLSGINLQLVNGTGTTDGAPNGLGNLIIGYDTARNDATYHCSTGTYTTQTTCQNAGETWAVSLKGGSHYLVIGDGNNYSQYSGIVNGYYNTSNNVYASAIGGIYNTASGLNSAISGGGYNVASGISSSISGGFYNTASSLSSISGGFRNTASASYSSVSGGYYNNATGGGSSVSGGYKNTAGGGYSSISGGNTHSAPSTYNWAAGTLLESQ